jgi:hypothetical protein
MKNIPRCRAAEGELKSPRESGGFFVGRWLCLGRMNSIKKGPPLLENQVAVLMADGSTGHILTHHGNIYSDPNEEAYIILESFEKARIFIDAKQKENDTVEFIIYDSNYKFLEFCKAGNWKKRI